MNYLLCVLLVYVHGRDDLYHALEPDQDLEYWAEDGWKMLNPVDPNQILELTFAIKQQNIEQLENLLLKVSDPDSKQYGEYISVEQITEMVSPTQKSIDAVRLWLAGYGVFEQSCQSTSNQDFFVCDVPCHVAELLLPGTSFSYFKHDKLKEPYIQSSTKYYVPRYIAKHLDFVGGVHRLPNANFYRTKAEIYSEANEESNIHIGIYPKVLRQRYNLTSSDVGSHPNNSQVVVQFLDQYFSNGDLAEFMKLFVGNDFAHKSRIDTIIGPNDGLLSGTEASLDTQYIMGLGANISTWFWSTAGRHRRQEPFLKWLVNVGNTSSIPHVHSVSYGEGENTRSKVYMHRVNVELMKLGLRGVTVLFASGDDGAACKHHKFSPMFPASSPYVTAVGGTAFYNPFTVGPERAFYISGGGFSNTFKQPSYQAHHVESFLGSSKVPPDTLFNRTGRAYPDVASICRHFWIVCNRVPVPGVLGTSASAPTVAGIISMVNEHRLKNNKPVMGFINPFLYKNPQVFYDVTSGYNEGCWRDGGHYGYFAGKGFDPVTGNGSPNYPDLVKAAMKVV